MFAQTANRVLQKPDKNGALTRVLADAPVIHEQTAGLVQIARASIRASPIVTPTPAFVQTAIRVSHRKDRNGALRRVSRQLTRSRIRTSGLTTHGRKGRRSLMPALCKSAQIMSRMIAAAQVHSITAAATQLRSAILFILVSFWVGCRPPRPPIEVGLEPSETN